jgi:hypothetical protein
LARTFHQVLKDFTVRTVPWNLQSDQWGATNNSLEPGLTVEQDQEDPPVWFDPSINCFDLWGPHSLAHVRVGACSCCAIFLQQHLCVWISLFLKFQARRVCWRGFLFLFKATVFDHYGVQCEPDQQSCLASAETKPVPGILAGNLVPELVVTFFFLCESLFLSMASQKLGSGRHLTGDFVGQCFFIFSSFLPVSAWLVPSPRVFPSLNKIWLWTTHLGHLTDPSRIHYSHSSD